MKNILAELHSIINELEDEGMQREALTLQNVFIKVAEDIDMEDDTDESSMQEEIASLVDKYGLDKVLEGLAHSMSDSGDETEEYAYGRPRVSVPGFNPRRLNTPDYGSQRTLEQIRRVQMGLDPDEVGPQPNSFDRDTPDDFRRTKFGPEDIEDDTQDYAFEPMPDVDRIYKMFDAGKTDQQIAKALGMDVNEIADYRRDYNSGDWPESYKDLERKPKTSDFAFETESSDVDPMRKSIVEKYHNLNNLWNSTGGKKGMDHNDATIAAQNEFGGFPKIGLNEIINNKPYPMGFKPKPYDPTPSMILESKPGYRD